MDSCWVWNENKSHEDENGWRSIMEIDDNSDTEMKEAPKSNGIRTESNGASSSSTNRKNSEGNIDYVSGSKTENEGNRDSLDILFASTSKFTERQKQTPFYLYRERKLGALFEPTRAPSPFDRAFKWPNKNDEIKVGYACKIIPGEDKCDKLDDGDEDVTMASTIQTLAKKYGRIFSNFEIQNSSSSSPAPRPAPPPPPRPAPPPPPPAFANFGRQNSMGLPRQFGQVKPFSVNAIEVNNNCYAIDSVNPAIRPVSSRKRSTNSSLLTLPRRDELPKFKSNSHNLMKVCKSGGSCTDRMKSEYLKNVMKIIGEAIKRMEEDPSNERETAQLRQIEIKLHNCSWLEIKSDLYGEPNLNFFAKPERPILKEICGPGQTRSFCSEIEKTVRDIAMLRLNVSGSSRKENSVSSNQKSPESPNRKSFKWLF